MAEKDPTARLRRAVIENNLFLVKRLVQRTDQRNPDASHQRYTSLAWAAVQGNEETFEFLLQNGHDDYECSRDAENNTILMLIADQRGALGDHYSHSSNGDIHRAALRMATLYHERYPKTLDWTNIHGKTPLHAAALKGNEELVRMLCDLGADFNLTDNRGNTPLHYASAWGHIPIVQLLIERGCQYSARNDDGFTASDYAYSFSTRDTLQDAARLQFELNKKSRRAIFAQAAHRGGEQMGIVPPNLHSESSRIRDIRSPMPRMRSGSGTSRTTNTSDSGEYENGLAAPHSHSSLSSSSPSSQPSIGSHYHPPSNLGHTATASATFPGQLNPPANPASALSQLASRVRERDADAMEKYMRRNRSESSSTDNKSMNGSYSSAGPSANGDNIASLGVFPPSGSTTPKRLRPSISASHLRSAEPPLSPTPEQPEIRTRSGTGPSSSSRPPPRPLPTLTRSSSTSNSPQPLTTQRHVVDEPGSFTGPPSQYAQFPEPPLPPEDNSTPTAGRRMGFHSIAKPLPSIDTLTAGHRRGMSAASFRGS
ncbi:ankyrin repeat-containing domain protein [Lentinula raphanica]|uniref:Ankyrin repeat-containing domain protein n=1 Tax=Lentinula raphanica TaxID=153919 RepID=A0AA38P7P8_9AGAR|nr:ankyrin repeat-containing domain protein [Lentinula raphanica]KAJ3976278.1 ankyrin repeat-containing domain protein [Lentinula raphanica]